MTAKVSGSAQCRSSKTTRTPPPPATAPKKRSTASATATWDSSTGPGASVRHSVMSRPSVERNGSMTAASGPTPRRTARRKRLGERSIRRRCVHVDSPPVQDRPAARLRLRCGRRREARLPDAGFPRKEHQPAAARCPRVERAGQRSAFGAAPDKRRGDGCRHLSPSSWRRFTTALSPADPIPVTGWTRAINALPASVQPPRPLPPLRAGARARQQPGDHCLDVGTCGHHILGCGDHRTSSARAPAITWQACRAVRG